MEFEPQDQDIVRLLTKLKNAEEQYPEPMFVARRQMFLRQMTEIGLGISTGVDAGIKNTARNPNTPPVSPVTGTLLETALLVAILVEASAVAYLYRDKLSDLFKTITTEPRVQQVEPVPVVATAVELQGVTPSPAITPTSPSATLSTSPTALIVTPASTSIPGVADDNGNTSSITSDTNTGTSNSSNNGNTSNSGTTQVASTPVPNVNNDRDHDDQGNHYGQTPKPERTIEPGNENGNPPQQNNNTDDNNSQTDSSDQSPADNSRPTREKRNP